MAGHRKFRIVLYKCLVTLLLINLHSNIISIGNTSLPLSRADDSSLSVHHKLPEDGLRSAEDYHYQLNLEQQLELPRLKVFKSPGFEILKDESLCPPKNQWKAAGGEADLNGKKPCVDEEDCAVSSSASAESVVAATSATGQWQKVVPRHNGNKLDEYEDVQVASENDKLVPMNEKFTTNGNCSWFEDKISSREKLTDLNSVGSAEVNQNQQKRTSTASASNTFVNLLRKPNRKFLHASAVSPSTAGDVATKIPPVTGSTAEVARPLFGGAAIAAETPEAMIEEVMTTTVTTSEPSSSNGGNGGNGGCQPDTKGTCRLWSCSAFRGPTKCVAGKCICLPGYCADMNGICRGCSHFSLEVHGVTNQVDKAGYYSAVMGFHFSQRPVWKQFQGNTWLWYCESHACWVMSDLMPNTVKCDAGIVSPPTSASSTPFHLAGVWKVWDGTKWVDDANNSITRWECQDLNHVGSIPAGEPYQAAPASELFDRRFYKIPVYQ